MEYKMKVKKIEYINGFKVIHCVPDITEEEREKIKQHILQKIYRDFKDKVQIKEKDNI
ncbi:hypothetical protein [Defluviitalea phaphyphila]|uniref:hypothetical protein n=1 Tax=Defluviitalea phaphyphila TaxID=1473580 RepID=UPI001366153A|nr:hypothetical protein [Defluviitalea phaphyphila]